MKIIHLSDTHVGRHDNLQRLSRLIDTILAEPPAAPGQCCVVHTGDLIDRAEDSFRQQGKAQLDRLRDAGFRVVLCPGNHDYGNALGISSRAAADFRQHFATYLFADAATEFPAVHRLDAQTVLILLDSNEAEMGFYSRLFAEGNLGQAQLKRLNELLDTPEIRQGKVILALHHHPFSDADAATPDSGDGHFLHHLTVNLTRSFRRLKDAYSLCEIIRSRVDYLLFGHRHFGLNCSNQSQFYDIPCALDAGSSTATDRRSDRAYYRILDSETGQLERKFLIF